MFLPSNQLFKLRHRTLNPLNLAFAVQ